MATSISNIVFSNASDAAIRAWAQGFIAQLVAVGLARSAEPPEINPTTATVVVGH